jgi:hypothetical protein
MSEEIVFPTITDRCDACGDLFDSGEGYCIVGTYAWCHEDCVRTGVVE